MSNIELWFPTAIYYADNILDQNEIDFLTGKVNDIKKITNNGKSHWLCEVYTTFKQYDLTKDNNFSHLISKVNFHINQFSKSFSSEYEYKCSEGWFNMYDKNQYQEFHYHPGHTFSAVYYLRAPVGSGPILFNSPLSPDMMPVKNLADENNFLTLEVCKYPAIQNRLIIFRSNLQHMVLKGTNETDRISLSFNA